MAWQLQSRHRMAAETRTVLDRRNQAAGSGRRMQKCSNSSSREASGSAPRRSNEPPPQRELYQLFYG